MPYDILYLYSNDSVSFVTISLYTVEWLPTNSHILIHIRHMPHILIHICHMPHILPHILAFSLSLGLGIPFLPTLPRLDLAVLCVGACVEIGHV